MRRSLLSTLAAAILGNLNFAQAMPTHHSNIIGATYLMTNDPSGSNIVIHGIAPNGSVSYAGVTPTGGLGQHAVGVTGPDALFVQVPLEVFGDHMFAVNPVSHTVTMFAIDPMNPTHIRMVGKPVASGGEFPTAMTVHPKTGVLYVVNAGAINGIQAFTADPIHGLRPLGPLHSLHLNQTTPTNGPLNTPSRVLVNQDGTKLRLAYKGNMTVPGYVATWNLSPSGTLSQTYTKAMPTSASQGPFPFGMANIVGAKDANLLGDAMIGAAIYDFSKPEPVIKPFPIPGQGATCWAVYSSHTGTYFLSDLDAANVYEMSVDLKTLSAKLDNTFPMGKGHAPLEITVGTIYNKDFLYVLVPPDSAIVVFALEKNGKSQPIQKYVFADDLAMHNVMYQPDNLEGMGVYIKKSAMY